MRSKELGVFAACGGYALMGNTLAPPQNIAPLPSLRSNMALGNAATRWRIKRLLAEAQMDWQESQEILAPAPDEQEEWDYSDHVLVLEALAFAPPVTSVAVEMRVTSVRRGEPHRASMGDFIFDMVDPESLELAPPLAEYDVVYDVELEEGAWPALMVDEVDSERFNV